MCKGNKCNPFLVLIAISSVGVCMQPFCKDGLAWLPLHACSMPYCGALLWATQVLAPSGSSVPASYSLCHGPREPLGKAKRPPPSFSCRALCTGTSPLRGGLSGTRAPSPIPAPAGTSRQHPEPRSSRWGPGSFQHVSRTGGAWPFLPGSLCQPLPLSQWLGTSVLPLCMLHTKAWSASGLEHHKRCSDKRICLIQQHAMVMLEGRFLYL